MKKLYRNFLLIIVPLFCIITTLLAAPLVNGQSVVFSPQWSEDAPNIDGLIDSDEWDAGEYQYLNLTASSTDEGLPIQIKILQNEQSIYFLFEFMLENPSEEYQEFLSIEIIDAESTLNYSDLKIVNLTNGNYSYYDYYYQNLNYILDNKSDGIAAATVSNLEGNKLKIIYEFKFSVYSDTSISDDEDIIIFYGSSYTINVSHGNDFNFPNGFLRNDLFTLNVLENPDSTNQPINFESAYFISSVVIFSIVSIFMIFYFYKVILLNRDIKRFEG